MREPIIFNRELIEEKKAWSKTLAQPGGVSNLIADFERPQTQSSRKESTDITLPDDLYRSLTRLAGDSPFLLFTVLMAALKICLYRYNGSERVVVGTPATKESSRANALAIVTGISERMSFRQLLGTLRETLLETYSRQNYPFYQLVHDLNIEIAVNRCPLFDVTLALENIHGPLPELNNDITINFAKTTDQLSGRIEFNPDLFQPATIERFKFHFLNVLGQGLERTETLVSEFDLLSENERGQLLIEWNDTATTRPRQYFHELFERQVELRPEAIALSFGEQLLTYAELNERANQLAHYLRDFGVGPDVLVAVMLERSFDMIISVLAVLKAGGAYLPLDPTYPVDRLSFMLEDAQAAVLITRYELVDDLPASWTRVIDLDTDAAIIAAQSRENPGVEVDAENLAYVIYTSGSTGQPKGVMVAHRGVTNLAASMAEALDVNADSRVLQFSSLSFDASVSEIVISLFGGARVCLESQESLLPGPELVQLFNDRAITTVTLPPSVLAMLPDDDLPALRTITVAGEACPATVAQRWSEGRKFINAYGPTEATVCATLTQILDRGLRRPPIGHPISNTQVYLLDQNLLPVPIGVPGELYIGGISLSRGYLHRPDLTAERFIPNPFSSQPGARLYRTGDLARYLASGEIDYLGRADNQVKVHGYRIELGEIEALLDAHPAVRESLVIAREDEPGDKRLVAYVASTDEQPPTTSELHSYLKEKLPLFMVPSAFVMLDQWPLSPNGKIDTRALPTPDQERPELEETFVAPVTPVEQLLANIWADILRIEKVGIHDNFFELGGDSVLSIQIVSRANQAGLQLKPKQIFQHQTIAELASIAGTLPEVLAEQGVVVGPVPLTPIQHWFFEHHQENPHHYNQSVLLEVGAEFDPSLLEQTVRELLLHHDALRLRFAVEEGKWRQWISEPETEVPFSSYDFSELTEDAQRTAIEETAAKLQVSLNLTTGPLMRAAYFGLGARGGRVLVLIHHIAVDGVSWRIVLEDLQRAYEQLERGEQVALGAKTTSWQQWGEQLAAYAQSEAVQSELSHWLRGEGVSELPVDQTAGANLESTAQTVTVKLSAEETESLLREVPKAHQTQINEVLLTALLQACGRWSGESRLLVDLEGHGREEISEDLDLSRTVGWFTSITPVLLEQPAGGTAAETLAAVKDQLRGIPQRGIGYGLLRYLSEDEKVVEQLREQPKPDLSFNYIGQVDQSFNESALLKATREPIGPIADPATPLPHKIYVNGIVFEGQLLMRFKYSDNLYRSATIEKLAGDFMTNLRSLIAECRSSVARRHRVADFPLLKVDQEMLDQAFAQISFTGMSGQASYENIADAYPLSPAQEGILFHSLYERGTGAYVVQISCTFNGLNVSAVEQAWQRVVERHPILRSAFVWGELDKPLQVVGNRVELRFDKQDWRDRSAHQQDQQLQAYLATDRSRGFESSEGPLMRFALLQIQDDAYHFVWSHHHLLLDGWSIFMVLKEVFEYYEAFNQGRELEKPETATYRDYLAWLQEHDLSGAKEFWQRTLKGFTTPNELRMDGTPDAEVGYSEQIVELPATLTAEVQSLARQHHLTLNTLVQGAWSLLLSHYSNQNDVVFGATASGRNASVTGIEEMVGIFINVLPARVQIRPEASLLSWLRELQQKQFEVRDYEYSPLAQVQRWSEVQRGAPLFQSILSFENYPVDDSIRQYTESLEISNVRSTSQTNYPITVIVAPLKRLKVRVVYDRSRFNAAFIRRMQEHFSTLLHNFVVHPEASLNTLAEMLVQNDNNLLAAQQREARKFSSTRFKKASPKVMNLPQGELVVMDNFDGPNSLPLVVRPTINELDLIDWAKDNRELIEKRLLRHGALLFRGFQIETASQFEQLAQVICPDLFGEYGDLPREGVGGKVY
ncbi:MAG TPA: amino acid adenylation domain-containing protein, partial [Pyrinomonadaceae bacterium]|nr:amino acid adenylation domain-containing protein [Pyrinomonadaceae bacterium]